MYENICNLPPRAQHCKSSDSYNRTVIAPPGANTTPPLRIPVLGCSELFSSSFCITVPSTVATTTACRTNRGNERIH